MPILPRVARGEPAAVDECLDRYGGLVWSLACRLTPSPADAEDAAQDIFIDLWRNAWRFRAEAGTEVAFVSTLARRRLADRQRRSLRARPAESLGERDAAVTAPALDGALELAEDAERARNCLKKLKDRDREVIELSVYAGLSQSRIAERLNAPLGTVKTLVRRALIQLRDCMGLAPRRSGTEVAAHD
ncbi:MAG TPA: sigma-70 family RNA polymerase sigma factor [Gemmataceae bacterium]|nr:sigma-70 family RNA polymerase sigma factor [Gemmataceae bacterium]